MGYYTELVYGATVLSCRLTFAFDLLLHFLGEYYYTCYLIVWVEFVILTSFPLALRVASVVAFLGLGFFYVYLIPYKVDASVSLCTISWCGTRC